MQILDPAENDSFAYLPRGKDPGGWTIPRRCIVSRRRQLKREEDARVGEKPLIKHRNRELAEGLSAFCLGEVADEHLHSQFLANKKAALGGEATTVPAPKRPSQS